MLSKVNEMERIEARMANRLCKYAQRYRKWYNIIVN